jgi:hypothetical protein
LQKKTKEGDGVGIWVTYLILITGLSIDKQKLPVPNTDNKGKLFVTLFAFVPAPKTNS